MVYDFLVSAILVLFLCGVVIWVDLSSHRKHSNLKLGVMFGLITIFVMNGKVMLVEGHFFDFRHLTMTMAGFMGGPVTAAIAAAISSLYQYKAGGSGLMAGIINIIVFACFGSILRRRLRHQNRMKVWFWLFIGIVMTCFLLLIMPIISPWKSGSVMVFRGISGPLLIITSLTTTVIFNFYFWTTHFLAKSSILNTIINSSPLNLMVFDTHGPILLSNNLKTQGNVLREIQNSFPFLDISRTGLNRTNPQQKEISTEDGRHLVIDLSGFQTPSGHDACVAIVNDVTDRKREQETLREAKEMFSKAFQLGPHMMSIMRKSDYRYVDVNLRFLEARGVTREEVIGKTPFEIGVHKSEFMKVIEILESEGSVQNFEITLVTEYGSVVTVIISAEKVQINDLECILFAYNDLSEIKRMQTERVKQLTDHLKLEADLSRSNQLIADIIDNLPDGFYVLDEQWRFTYLNKKAEEIVLRSREDLLGKVLWEAFPQIQEKFKPNYQKFKGDGVPITFEYQSFIQKDIWYQVTAFPCQFGMSVYYKDITEQKLSHEKWIKSQAETASILESMTDSFFAINRDWIFTYINRPAEIAFGKSREELLGKKMTEVFKLHDTSLLNYKTVMTEKRSITYEIISEMLGNTWVEISLYPTESGLTCYFQDITNRKRSEKELARLDRLYLVGQLAAGIGHEIRNPMTTVRGYLQLLGEKPEYSTQKSTFELMISELDRANAIITDFLSLARIKQTELKPQNLNTILNHLYPLLEADTFNQNKQICFIAEEIPNLKLNGNEISQLILNLARNGLEAMGDRGCLTIKSYQEDNKVVLAIMDEGCGISAEDLPKLGTPFFTTKDNGTGLGLATCYKIAESHNAKIQIKSSSRGTTFFILFPIDKDDKGQNELIA